MYGVRTVSGGHTVDSDPVRGPLCCEALSKIGNCRLGGVVEHLEALLVINGYFLGISNLGQRLILSSLVDYLGRHAGGDDD
jgi:hypothetical protein